MWTKEHVKEYQRNYRRKQRLDEEYREKQRLFYRDWYKKNGRNRNGNYMEAIYEWQQEHPDRVNVSALLQRAVRRGIILKPNACQECKRIVRLSGHHEDYSKPLEVVWLCSSCHKLKHIPSLT